jgi:hypothetical protein
VARLRVRQRWTHAASAPAHDDHHDGLSYLAALDVRELRVVKDRAADRNVAVSRCHDELGAVVSQVVTSWSALREL